MSTFKRSFDMLEGQGNLHSPKVREGIRGLFPTVIPEFLPKFGFERLEIVSETNPPPTAQPPAEPAPAVPAPTQPPAQPPAPPLQPPAAPDMTGVLTRLEQVITGLPERTANAVREVSPQHVPNPTANPAEQPGTPGQQAATNPTGAGKKQGPGKIASWFFGMND